MLKRADRSLDTNCGVKVVVRHGLKNLCLQLRCSSRLSEPCHYVQAAVHALWQTSPEALSVQLKAEGRVGGVCG